jgi:tellurite resistance protein TehA-like permease
VNAIANFFPGYFAMVMATGAVSIASSLLGMPSIALALLYINIVAYATLAVITGIRLITFPSRVAADLADHARGPGFFTLVAGTCILGAQFVTVLNRRATAEWLFAIGVVLWLVIMYSFFTAVIVRRDKPDIRTGINGAWLIATVATQSVAVLASVLQTPFQLDAAVTGFVATVFFLIGCMLYMAIITLIFYRLTFIEVDTETLTPPYWINMGAVAITTLAGSSLILRFGNDPLISALSPFLKGFTLFFWSAATWWVPTLLVLGVWRHLWKRYPLKYDPQYWGMVFPLGMYTMATWRLSEALDVEWLKGIPRTFIYVAIFAWTVTMLGLAMTWLRPRTRSSR